MKKQNSESSSDSNSSQQSEVITLKEKMRPLARLIVQRIIEEHTVDVMVHTK